MDQIMIDLVKEEAANLKKLATAEELQKLDIHILNHDNIYNCIYGQMTGHCHSRRAADLIINCCPRVYDATNDGNLNIERAVLNGKPSKDIIWSREEDRWSRREHYSPIETFLFPSSRQQKESLVSYLKGEVETLDIRLKSPDNG